MNYFRFLDIKKIGDYSLCYKDIVKVWDVKTN